MANKHNVFVYGTLRPWEDGNYLPATHFLIRFNMFSAGAFPYIVASGNDDRVMGNILTVNDKQLAQLDKIEGLERGLYTRETAYAWDVNGEEERVLCNVYVAGPLLLPQPIESGDWRQYQGQLFGV